MEERLTITDVAKMVGVTAKTILRWEKAGKIRKPKRDWKGWRIYLQEDVTNIQRIVNTVYEDGHYESQAVSGDRSIVNHDSVKSEA